MLHYSENTSDENVSPIADPDMEMASPVLESQEIVDTEGTFWLA